MSMPDQVIRERLLREVLRDLGRRGLHQSPPGKVTVVVKGLPVTNDATMVDAEAGGVTRFATVIDNGSDAPGTILEDCSEGFREGFGEADLVVAKGQGNYRTLSEAEKGIFFMLKAKCPVIVRDIGCDAGSLVLRRPGFPESDTEKGGEDARF